MSDATCPSSPSTVSPRLSLVIDNHNAAAHVGRAIESALAQTCADRIEVIVVDDGSTDDSLAVIGRYAERGVRVVARPEGGQGAAYNAGFAAARGERVLFLDADDWLYPDAVAEVLAAWEPGVSKVQFLLDLVDADGHPLGRQVPRELHDVEAPQLLREYGAYGSPPGSGNVYDRAFLAQVLPMDEATWRLDADSIPVLLAPVYGRVLSLPLALGAYRVRGPERQTLVLHHGQGSLRAEYRRIRDGKAAVVATLDRLGVPHATPIGLAPWEARTLVLCARFGGAETRAEMTPSVPALLWQALCSVWRWPLLLPRRRWLMLGWMVAVTLLPGWPAHWLARQHRRHAGAVDPNLSARTAATRLSVLASRP